MSINIQQNSEGLFIQTETAILVPESPSSFGEGDAVKLEYMPDSQVIVSDLYVPYEELWITKIIEKVEPIKKRNLDISKLDNLHETDIITLILYTIAVVATVIEFHIIYKMLT
jgi:hypothetical protein